MDITQLEIGVIDGPSVLCCWLARMWHSVLIAVRQSSLIWSHGGVRSAVPAACVPAASTAVVRVGREQPRPATISLQLACVASSAVLEYEDPGGRCMARGVRAWSQCGRLSGLLGWKGAVSGGSANLLLSGGVLEESSCTASTPPPRTRMYLPGVRVARGGVGGVWGEGG